MFFEELFEKLSEVFDKVYNFIFQYADDPSEKYFEY
jgi:hypothetical protein